MDYSTYQLERKESLLITLQGLGITALIAIFCYRHILALALGILILPLWRRMQYQRLLKKQTNALRREFLEALQSVSGALYAGYSMENAWLSAREDLHMIYQGKSMMVREIDHMLKALSIGKNLGMILRDLGERSGLEEVKTLCQVLEFAMKAGGDFSKIIQSAIGRMLDQYEVCLEIDAITAEKQLEYKIMLIVPVGIIIYISLASPGYLDAIYTTLLGRVVMSLCLVAYAAAIYMAKKFIAMI